MKSNEDVSVKANFAVNTYNASFATVGDGAVKLYVNDDTEAITTSPYVFEEGDSLTFVAVANTGSHFVNWNDDETLTDDTYIVKSTEDVTVKANFEVDVEGVFRIICEKENGGIDVRYSNPMSTPGVALVYTIDKHNWANYTIGDTLHLDNKGDIVYIKADTTNSKICSRSYSSNTMPDPTTLVPGIYVSDSASVAGNIMYLLDNTGQSTTMESDAFAGLFATDNIVNANELILPADTVSTRAYSSMFLYCTTLQNAPELPATVVGYSGYLTMFAHCSSLESVPSILPADSVDFKAYESMFEACTVLNTVPEISATKIGEDGCRMMFRSCTSLETAAEINATQLQPACYQYMYEGCTSLVDAPALPATTLQPRCYSFMFANCTSLETAPVLPAQTLVNECYRNMFDGCSSLNRIEVAFTGDWDKWKTYNWTRNVAAEGTFVCPAELTETRNSGTNYHYIPTLWNVVRPAQPENDIFRVICEKENGGIDVVFVNPLGLQDIALVYSYDKQNWTDLTPILDTLRLANKGDVVYIKATTTNTRCRGSQIDQYTTQKIRGLSPAISVSDSASVAGNIMFLLNNEGKGNTVGLFGLTGLFVGNKIIEAKDLILPADTLFGNAYHSMFYGCSTLKSAPELPAKVFKGDSTYKCMFAYCSSLVAGPSVLPAEIVGKQAYQAMFAGCSSLETAPAISATTIKYLCQQAFSNMFLGCTSLETAATINITELYNYCYESMYQGCTSLVDAPALPATTLKTGCYQKMFMGCTSLETAPFLPATTLASNCYTQMFDGCSDLNYIKVAFTTTWNTSYTSNWTRGVAEEGTFVCPVGLTNTRNTSSAFHYIPTLWDIVNPAQQNAPRHAEKAVEYIAMGEGMNIIVSGAEDAMVYVYDVAGHLVSSIANASDFETIPVAVPGVYVVVVPGQEPTRVVVK